MFGTSRTTDHLPGAHAMMSVARHYSRHAERLSRTYLEVAFEEIHGAWLNHLPSPGARVLDVGAGSGRDARALASRGYLVTAVEPSAPMRRRGVAAVQPFAVKWIDDRLPELTIVRTEAAAFEFVLCSAVLMHLPRTELTKAVESLAAVTALGGRIAVTLRESREGDPEGVYHDHFDADLVQAASAAHLSLIDHGVSGDRFDRPKVSWRWFVFTRPDIHVGR